MRRSGTMDLNKAFIDRARDNGNKYSDVETLTKIGFLRFNRTIRFFVDEKHNLYNISGNHVLSCVSCTVTNESVFKLSDGNIGYNKTVYLCETELPNDFDVEILKKHLDKYLENITIRPLYAFSNDHIDLKDGSFYDFGLSLVDLTNTIIAHGAVHMRHNHDHVEHYERFIDTNFYNPKYYSTLDAKMLGSTTESREMVLNELVDSKTKMLFNKAKPEVLSVWDNGALMEGVYIDKRLMDIDSFMEDMFMGFLFNPLKALEFVYDSTMPRDRSLNISKLSSFAKFNDDGALHYALDVQKGIYDNVDKLKSKINEDFYVIFEISEQFVTTDIRFYKDRKQIRIIRPIHKQYGDFALNFNVMKDEHNIKASLIESDKIDTTLKGTGMLENLSMIRDAIEFIDGATRSVQLLLDTARDRIPSKEPLCINERRLLEDPERFQSNLRN